MADPKYIKIVGNGSIVIDIDSLPDSAFIPGVVVRDICMAKIAGKGDRQGMKNPEADVICESALGNKRSISRKDLVNMYRHASGNKIRISGWRKDKKYLVYTVMNQPVGVFILPDNCSGNLRNSRVAPGHYILLPVSSGGYDKVNPVVLKKSIARKLLYIPENDKIRELVNKPHKSGSTAMRAREWAAGIIKNSTKKKEEKQAKAQEAARKEPRPQVDMSERIKNMASTESTPKSNQSAQGAQSLQGGEAARSRYTCVAKLISSKNGQLVGYVIKSPSGVTKNMTMTDVARMCEKKAIANMEIVANIDSNTGKVKSKFLRGNGISLKELPEQYV